jgi:DNA-binding CsgD family transcriptional regulator
MGPRDSAIIDFTEAVYDLKARHEAWLPKLVEAGARVLDHGLGVFALTCVRPAQPGPLVIDQLHIASGHDEFARGVTELRDQLDLSLLWPLSRPGMPKTLSEVTADHNPAAFDAIMRHFGFAKDALGIAAFDPDGRGVYLLLALPKITSLSDRARERWQMLAAHFSAGYRLRRAIEDADAEASGAGDLPFGAEAVIDPTTFSVAEATGKARSPKALTALREAAQKVDRARGRMRESDPQAALELWRALVRGRWSTVDWFDSDGRRYVLGIPNAPEITDPRGLSEQEMQVVSYAVQGMTNKMIGYYLGVSKGRVSTVLSSAMRKLGVQTRAQLVKKLLDFQSISGP